LRKIYVQIQDKLKMEIVNQSLPMFDTDFLERMYDIVNNRFRDYTYNITQIVDIQPPPKPTEPTHIKRCPKKEKSPNKKSKAKPKEIECCAMCIEDMNKQCECTKLPCGHIFHTNCISNLRDSSISNKCPLCRADLPPGTLEEEVYEEQRKHYKHTQKIYSGRHCSVLHSQIIYKSTGAESSIWCTFPWEYNGPVKVKTRYNGPTQKSKKNKRKFKNYKTGY
jgi:hypothetical protein